MIDQKYKKKLLKSAIGSIAVKFSFAFISLLTSVMLARHLGPSGFGIYSFAIAVVMLISIPATAGIPELLVRETAKIHVTENWSLLGGIWLWCGRFVMLFSIVVVFVCASIFFFYFDGPKSQTITIGLLVIPLMAMTSVKSACIRGIGYTTLGQLPDSIIRTLVFFLLIIFATFYVSELNSMIAISLYLISTIIALLVSMYLLSRYKPFQLKYINKLTYETSLWYKAIIPLSLITGLQVVNGYTDIIVLGLYRDNEEVGIYKAVVQLSLLVGFGLQAINQVLHPHFSKLYALNETEKLQKLVTISARFILIVSLMPVLLFIFLGANILNLIFGNAYAVGGTALAILAIGQLINAAMGSVGALLNMTGHERYTIRGVALAAIVNILLNFILAPSFGMLGAAIATAVSMIMWNLLLRYYVRKLLSIEPSALFNLTNFKGKT